MNRTLLGILALACLIGGAVLLAMGHGGEVAGALIKVGSVLGALWLALPSITGILSRTPKWMLTAAVIGIVICVIRPWLLVVVVPLIAGLWILSGRILSSPADPTILGRRQRRQRTTGDGRKPHDEKISRRSDA